MIRRLSLALAAALLLALPAMAAVPLLPPEMQPDTILTYDEDLNPVILRGGYLPEARYAPRAPTPTAVPPAATPEEAAAYRAADQAAAIRYFDQMAGYAPADYLEDAAYRTDDAGCVSSLVYHPGCGVYPGMVVEYWHDGTLQNIYYPDPASPDGYSLHNCPPAEAARADIATPSRALPFVLAMRALVLRF